MKPDHDNELDKWRRRLIELNEKAGFSSQRILNAFANSSRRTTDIVSRTTLERFKKGEHVKRTTQILELCHFVERLPVYARVFGNVDTGDESSVEDTLSKTIQQFFRESLRTRHSFDIGYIREKFPGRYVMYRPDPRPSMRKGRMQASIMTISAIDNGVSLSELQQFAETDEEPAYHQYDSGVMFPFGKYIYFLMREEEGTCVKLGVIEANLPKGGDLNVDTFWGSLFVSSHMSVFPVIKFYCKRIDSTRNREIAVGPMDMKQIPFDGALAYFSGFDEQEKTSK